MAFSPTPTPATLQFKLSAKDIAKVQEVLTHVYELRDSAAIPPMMLDVISGLISNLFCTYNEINLRTGTLVAAYHPESMREPMEALMPQLSACVQDHPIYRNLFSVGEVMPQLISDFTSVKEWNQLEFAKYAATLGIHESLTFSLRVTARSWIFICLNRGQRDFTERDRAMAALLREHFSVAYANAIAFTEERAKAAIFDRLSNSRPYGIIFLDASGRVLHMNERVHDLIESYFPERPDWKTALPNIIVQWLADQTAVAQPAASPLVILRENKKLVIHYSVDDESRRMLLFREVEMQDGFEPLLALGLRKRQAEVLYWMSQGKSNFDIGIILEISSRTVEKHLELIYRHLRLETRMAAMVVAHGVLAHH